MRLRAKLKKLKKKLPRPPVFYQGSWVDPKTGEVLETFGPTDDNGQSPDGPEKTAPDESPRGKNPRGESHNARSPG